MRLHYIIIIIRIKSEKGAVVMGPNLVQEQVLKLKMN